MMFDKNEEKNIIIDESKKKINELEKENIESKTKINKLEKKINEFEKKFDKIE